MSYPWPSFGSFKFDNSERPVDKSDSYWKANPTYDRSHPLGSNRDDIQIMSFNSLERVFEAWFVPSRHKLITALIATPGVFTDWTRPLPDSRAAFLLNVEPLERAGSALGFFPDRSVDYTREARRCRLTLVSQ